MSNVATGVPETSYYLEELPAYNIGECLKKNSNGTFSIVQLYSGLTKISVETSSPTSPQVGDLWIDTN